jgi:hypothetical protein
MKSYSPGIYDLILFLGISCFDNVYMLVLIYYKSFGMSMTLIAGKTRG